MDNLQQIIEKNKAFLGKPINSDVGFYSLIEYEKDKEDAKVAVKAIIYNPDQEEKKAAEELLRHTFGGSEVWQFVAVYHLPEIKCDIFATTNKRKDFLYVSSAYCS